MGATRSWRTDIFAKVEIGDGRFERAAELAGRVATIDPRHTASRYLLFQIHRQMSRKAKAAGRSADALRLGEEAKRYLALSRKLREEEEKRRDVEVKTNGLLGLAFKFLRQRKTVQAIGYLAEVLTVDPGNRQSRKALAGLLRSYQRAGQGAHPDAQRIRTLLR